MLCFIINNTHGLVYNSRRYNELTQVGEINKELRESNSIKQLYIVSKQIAEFFKMFPKSKFRTAILDDLENKISEIK